VNFANGLIDYGALEFEFRILGYPNCCKILRVNRHSQRFHAFLRKNPINNSLCGLFGVALILERRVDRKGDTDASSFVRRTATSLVFLSKNSQPHQPTSPG